MNEAVRWDGFNKGEIEAFCPGSATWIDSGQGYYLLINTLEGTINASIGDWVVKDSGGFYPVKPDIFAQTYELVE